MRDFAELPGFTLRRLQPSDIEAFIELGLPTCVFMHGRPGIPDSRMRRDFSAFVHEYAFSPESEIHVVASPDGSLAAQLWLHSARNRFNGISEMWVWDITVHEGYRRRGIGTHLLRFATERARESDCAELWLLVSGKNDNAVKIYRTAGMSPFAHLMMMPVGDPKSRLETPIHVQAAELRVLGPSDIPDLLKLWRKSGLGFRPKGRDREDRLIRHLSGPMPGGWAAFTDGGMVGAAIISSDGRKGWIERLATLPEHRRAGLAKALVTACMQSLKENGALVIGALIAKDNVPSRRLFESFGFVSDEAYLYYSVRENPEC